MSARSKLTRIAAIVVGGVLVAAAVAKMVAPAAAFSLFGSIAQAAPWLAWAVVLAEFLLGLWLIVGWRLPVAGILALLLLSAFTGVIIHDLTLHYPVPCGCFGQAWKQAHEPGAILRSLAMGLGRNAVLMATLAAVVLMGRPLPDVAMP